MERFEEACALLCLLTRAAWTPDLPPPLTRRAVHAMRRSGMLKGLVLRDAPGQGMGERTRKLLSRSAAVGALLEAYAEQGFTVLLPSMAAWPDALSVLGADAPPFLFARGSLSLLTLPRIAVAGSREIAPQTAGLAARVGRLLAREGVAMVCGGAHGVDNAAQRALLQAGGSLLLVPARTTAQVLDEHRMRRALDTGKLLLLCDTLPDEPFSAAKALTRNHTIYALGRAAWVIAARDGVGGSWHGATDCLRGGWRPVYAMQGEEADQAGCRTLLTRGARALHPDAMDQALEEALALIAPGYAQLSLLDAE